MVRTQPGILILGSKVRSESTQSGGRRSELEFLGQLRVKVGETNSKQNPCGKNRTDSVRTGPWQKTHVTGMEK
jgi:hypothetical protein